MYVKADEERVNNANLTSVFLFHNYNTGSLSKLVARRDWTLNFLLILRNAFMFMICLSKSVVGKNSSYQHYIFLYHYLHSLSEKSLPLPCCDSSRMHCASDI